MSLKMRFRLMAAGVIFAAMAAGPIAKAKSTEPELQLVRCTCYVATGNKTASGVYPYEGIVASTREHMKNGDVAILYTKDKELIGFFECRDIGGDERILNGTRIDIYRDSLDRAYEWVGEYGDFVYVQWKEADG